MAAIVTLAVKDLRLLMRDRAGLFWVMAFPLIMAILFGTIFGGDDDDRGRMRIALLDEDGSKGSRALADRLRESDALEVEDADREAAIAAVRRGKLTGYVAIRKGYGAAPMGGLVGGGDALVEVGIDPSRKAEASYLQGLILEAAFRGLQDAMSDPDVMREQVQRSRAEIEKESEVPADQRHLLGTFLGNVDDFLAAVDPGVYESGTGLAEPRVDTVEIRGDSRQPLSGYEVSFPQAMIWGLLGCVAAFAISLVRERMEGTYLRLRLSPLSRASILAGKGLACFVTSMAAVVAILAMGTLVFGVRVQSPASFALAALCSACCFVGIMMLVSTLGRTTQAVAGAGWASLLILSMIGGGMVPLMVMPSWMQSAASFSPVKWAILSVEGAIWRGFALGEMALPCGILLAVGAVCFVLGARRLATMDG